MNITPELLAHAYAAPLERVRPWAAPLSLAMLAAEVNTEDRIAAFLAQIGHESGRLRYTREIWGPTAAQRRYEPHTSLSRRLGNTKPGDGRRFAGHGPIQMTGRANHRAATTGLRELFGNDVPDFEADPEQLATSLWGSLAAGWFWRSRNLNRYADAGDLVTLRKRVNGGLNGQADCLLLFTAVRNRITGAL